MKQNSLVSLLLLTLLLIGVCLAGTEITNPTPIFDGNDGGLSPPLKLTRVRGWVLDPMRSAKSVKIERIQENWYTGKPPQPFPPDWHSRIVRIERWNFDNPKDPLAIPFANVGVTGSARFRGWHHQPEPAVGDATCWADHRLVYFVKGNTLIKLDINSKKIGQDYTLMIARKISESL